MAEDGVLLADLTFDLSHSNARGMFLVSNERACFKLQVDANFRRND